MNTLDNARYKRLSVGGDNETTATFFCSPFHVIHLSGLYHRSLFTRFKSKKGSTSSHRTNFVSTWKFGVPEFFEFLTFLFLW